MHSFHVMRRPAPDQPYAPRFLVRRGPWLIAAERTRPISFGMTALRTFNELQDIYKNYLLQYL